MDNNKAIAYISAAFIFLLVLFHPTESVVVEAPEYQNKILIKDLLEVNLILNSEISIKLDEMLSSYCKLTGFNGIVMAVDHGDLIYNKAFGYTDRGKTPINTQMPFQLASVSKQFTAAAIMKLKNDNLLDYDDNISKYIQDFPYEITIRQLLNHTSGLFNYMSILEEQWDNEDVFPDNDTLIKMISTSNLPLYFTPGKHFDYSNTGYAVLASIVEIISKKSFQNFMDEYFFTPLGMKDTYVSVGTNVSENSLNGFIRYRRGFYPYELTVHDGIVGDKGVYSTSWDLYKWDKSLYECSILPEEILNEAFTPTLINNRRIVPYGYGFRLKEDDNGEKIVYHNGVWEGFRINFHRYPETKSTILVMNNCGFNVNFLTSKVKAVIEELDNTEIETRFVINCLLNGNKEAAQYAYFLAKYNDKFNKEAFDEIVEYLWRNRYYQYYEFFVDLGVMNDVLI